MLPITPLAPSYHNSKTINGTPSHIFRNLSQKHNAITRFTTKKCLRSCLHWKNGDTISLAQTKYSKYGLTIKTYNTSDNHKKSIVDKPAGLLNSLNIILRFIIILEISTLNLIFCRGRKVLTRGRKTTKTSHCYPNNIFVLF